MADDVGMQIRIEGSDLPGRDCGRGENFPGYRNIHVGVQRRDRPGELLGPHPGDAAAATWLLECTCDGADIRGPYVQGRPGGRFVYLSWGTVDGGGAFAMFRRAKLMFDAIDGDVLAAALRGGLLVARLGLTDARGEPRCAQVRPPLIEWSAEASGRL